MFPQPCCIENKNYRNPPQNTKIQNNWLLQYYNIRARHKVRKEVKRYPRQYAHEYKQWTNKINVQNHKTHLSSVICLQISKYQEAKVSRILTKGHRPLPNRMNFRKSSKLPLTPPPLIFGKLYCGFRNKIATKVRMFIWRNFCVFYDPISHEMHVAQMFNMVIGWKHTLKRPFCIIFMVKNPV